VTCPEERLVAFLAGGLSSEEERRFHEHLLGCEQCWRAVQADRSARHALEQLSQPRAGRAPAPSRPHGHLQQKTISKIPRLRDAHAACLSELRRQRQIRQCLGSKASQARRSAGGGVRARPVSDTSNKGHYYQPAVIDQRVSAERHNQ
jgi:anti-sigma factor RsiW